MKRYIAIITTAEKKEIESLYPDYYAERPWAGRYCTVVGGTTSRQLLEKLPENEGRLYYQLYDTETGDQIGYGAVDANTFEADISEWLKGKFADTPLRNILSFCRTVDEYLCQELRQTTHSREWKKAATNLQEKLRDLQSAGGDLLEMK